MNALRWATLATLALVGLGTVFASSQPARAEDPPVLPAGLQAYLDATKPAWAADAELVKAVADSGANWGELTDILAVAAAPASPAVYREAMAWLLKNAPHLDRLEIESGVLSSHASAAFEDARRAGHAPGSSFFRRYMLNYRLDDEPVTSWRGTLWERYAEPASAAGRPELGAVRCIAGSIAAGFSIRERGYFGNLADPLSIDNSRAGTKREFALLTAAVFRALGYATRFVRDNASGESWVEVYGGGPVGEDDSGYDPAAWLPVYPTAPEHSGEYAYAATLCGGRITVITAGDAFGREQVTGRYGPVARARPVFLRSDGEVTDYEHWSISAFSKGAWVPLDDLEYPSSDKDYPLDEPGDDEGATVWYTLGAPGRYMFTCGARYPGGVSYVQTSLFEVEPEDYFEHYFGLDAPADLPPAAWVERSITLPEGEAGFISPQGRFLYLVTDDSEPSVRAREQFEQFRALSSVFYRELRRETQDAATAAFVKDVLGVNETDGLPVAILVIDGRTALYTRGFNLNAADWVMRALGGEK